MTSYTLDELIRLALTEVKLQNQFFSPTTKEQESRLQDARRQYRDARQEIIQKTPTSWAKRTLTLTQEVTLEDGWYRLPADCIQLEDPSQIIDTGADREGGIIYRLGSPTINYWADTNEEERDPLFQRAVRYRFLSKLCLSEDSASIYLQIILNKEKESYQDWFAAVGAKRDMIKRTLPKRQSRISNRII